MLRLVAFKLAGVSGGGQAFRVGGEEFNILFPGRTLFDVTDHLELLRMDIEGSSFRVRTGEDRRKLPRQADRRAAAQRKRGAARTGSSMLSVTVSIGVAESHPKLDVDEVIQQADKALYRAKQGGRNRIEIAPLQGRPKKKSRRSGPAS